MRCTQAILMLVVLVPVGRAQTEGPRAPMEFDAASIHVNAPQTGFHALPEKVTGGPGTADPGMFRCSGCTLATLIGKAFGLQPWQLPGRTSLPDSSFEVTARIPQSATQDDFKAMLQNMLVARFGLKYHFTEKNLRGYQLVISARGSKLKASSVESRPAAGSGPYHFDQGEGHAHSGPMIFHGSAMWRRDHQTTADLARMISDQLNVPVEDRTRLEGQYDISLAWAAGIGAPGNHSDDAWGGAHGDRGGGGSPSPTGPASADASGPTLFEALQYQLGLQLVPASQAAVRVFVVDRVQALPTEN